MTTSLRHAVGTQVRLLCSHPVGWAWPSVAMRWAQPALGAAWLEPRWAWTSGGSVRRGDSESVGHREPMVTWPSWPWRMFLLAVAE